MAVLVATAAAPGPSIPFLTMILILQVRWPIIPRQEVEQEEVVVAVQQVVVAVE
jgi:hypothetical protein